MRFAPQFPLLFETFTAGFPNQFLKRLKTKSDVLLTVASARRIDGEKVTVVVECSGLQAPDGFPLPGN